MTGLIITDSLGLPRCEVGKEDTWVFNLMSHSKNINYMYLKRGGTTKDLKTVMVNFYYLKPDYIIMQLGICDCTRRVKPRKLAGMKRKLRGGGVKLNRIVYKNLNRAFFQWLIRLSIKVQKLINFCVWLNIKK